MYIPAKPLSLGLASLVIKFCQRHGWTETALLSQARYENDGFARSFREHAHNAGVEVGHSMPVMTLLADVSIGDELTSGSAKAVKRKLLQSRASVVVVRLDGATCAQIFNALGRRLSAERLWILTGNAAKVTTKRLFLLS